MRAEELKRRIDELGLSQAALARRLTEETGNQYGRQHVHRWLAGVRPVPGPIAALVRAWGRIGVLPAPSVVAVEPISLRDARKLLLRWAHRHGPISRPVRTDAHVVRAHGTPVAIVTTSELVQPPVAGDLYRDDAIELSRLCCESPEWSRVALRLWRNAIFPMYRRAWAISYQDTILHDGSLYRFDGWVRIEATRPGPDRRSGRVPSPKIVWAWTPDTARMKARALPDKAVST